MNDLFVGIVNVVLEDVGMVCGVVNFLICGLGINSFIMLIDLIVGVFVDGVFIGINGGVVVDMFDIECVEVLCGFQGILFGCNVIGGVILIIMKKLDDMVIVKLCGLVIGGGLGGLNKMI